MVFLQKFPSQMPSVFIEGTEGDDPEYTITEEGGDVFYIHNSTNEKVRSLFGSWLGKSVPAIRLGTGMDNCTGIFTSISPQNRYFAPVYRSTQCCSDLLSLSSYINGHSQEFDFYARFRGFLVALPRLLLFVGCLTSQQHASVSQGRICSDNFMCCHTEIEAADQTFYLTQSQYTDTGPTSPSSDPITPGAWQGSHWSANV